MSLGRPARAGDTAAAVPATLPGVRYDFVDDVVVLDNRRLIGIVPMEDILAAPDAQVGDLMDADPPSVEPDSDQESVAWEMVRKNESSVAVVNDDGQFVGLVAPTAW